MSVRAATVSGAERLLLLAPIMPARSGNGLAMRTELFRRSAPAGVELTTVVVPVAGCIPFAASLAPIVVHPDPAHARTGVLRLTAAPSWRARLAEAGVLPPAARVASPGLAELVVGSLGGASDAGSVGIHVVRAYMAPLGIAIAEQLGAAWCTLDLDDDDAAFARAAGDEQTAAAYDRLLAVFGPLFDRLAASSAIEAAAIGRRCGLSVEELPNAVTIPPPRGVGAGPPPGERADVSLLFVGNLTYAPNIEAARLLVDEIAPALGRRSAKEVRVILAGPCGSEVEELRGPRVELTGFVPDLAPLYAAADAVVVALRQGAGTRIKLLEAFAHQVPVVATHAAAAGLEVIDGRHLLLRDGIDELVTAVEHVLANGELSARLAEESFQLVCERYSCDVVIPRIRAFFERASGARGAQSVAS